MSKQDLLADICAFLQQRIDENEVTGDQKESAALAIDCIKDAFGLSAEPKSKHDLLQVYEKAVGSTANDETEDGVEMSEPYHPVEVSEADKAAAEELKAEGNKLMGHHQFKEAADKYSEAIAKDPNSALFYSNRAAAFTHLQLPQRAIEDARQAVRIDPLYAKAWSRLGHALWTQNDVKGALEAYENGLKVEGDHPTEAMKRDYETVKKRFEELEKESMEAPSAGAGAGAGGLGGLDFGNLAGLMNNPQIRQMASELMSDPSKLQDLMNNPMLQSMRNSFGGGPSGSST